MNEDVILVDSELKIKKVKSFYRELQNMRDKLDTNEDIHYSCVPISMSLRYNILINDFLFHELVIKNRKFYQEPSYLKDKGELVNLLAEVLSFELSLDAGKQTIREASLNRLITAHKRLNK